MKPDALVHKWVRAQQRRGLAELTIDKRRRSLLMFAEQVGFDCTRDQIEDWLDGRKLSSKSRAVWISHLGCFFRWALSESLLPTDPTARIKPPKLRRRLPRPVTDKELTRLLEGANSRQRAMILLASLGGLRCCELSSLRVEDVLPEGLVRVVGKGDRERAIPLHPDAAKALAALPEASGDLVFGGASPGAVSHEIGRLMHKLDIAGGAHRLRHWNATRLYAQTHDLRLVQECLGHASPATTAIYAGWDQAAARVAVRALKVGA
jgi:site-specific recombinase XerD